MKKHRKAKRRVCTALFCILLAVYVLWGRAWPRRWFVSYDHFYHMTSPGNGPYRIFPEKLPASAADKEYFFITNV